MFGRAVKLKKIFDSPKRNVSLTFLSVLILLVATLYTSPIISVKATSTTIRVPQDYPTIQGAINAANPGDTIQVATGTYYEHVIVGKSVRIIGADTSTTFIDGGGSGSIFDLTANGVTVSGFTIKNAYYGVNLESAHGNTVSNNVFTGISFPICLSYSHNNIISSNIGSGIWSGIYVAYSSGNIISENTMSGGDSCGIYLYYSDDNNVTDNVVIDNGYGIQLEVSTENTVSDNDIKGNWHGIQLYDADNNVIYHNNLIENDVQVDSWGSSNTWDDGVGRGNHWSDYNGEDLNGDGVGDTNLPWRGFDDYPLMSRWDCTLPPPPPYGPTAKFTHSPTSPYVNQTVTFDASDSLSGWDGTSLVPIVSYAWDFGDGNQTTSSQPILSHKYFADGDYSVTLKVTDTEGQWNTANKQVMVMRTQGGVLIVDDDGTGHFHTIQEAINAADPGDTIRVLAGTYSELVFVNKSVRLIGDGSGRTIIDASTSLFYGFRVKAAGVHIYGFTIQNAHYGIELWQFDNIFIINNTLYNNWKGIYFASGEPLEHIIIYHNNFINNTYQIFQWAYNPAPLCTWDNGREGNYWSDYSGTDLNGDGVGDTFLPAPDGYVDEYLDPEEPRVDYYPLMKPYIGAPKPNFTYTPQAPYINQEVTFDASGSSLGWNGTHNTPIVSYVWDFGDGSTGTGVNVNHAYTAADTYTVTLNVTDSQGLSDTTSKTVEVSLPPPPHGPTAHFTYRSKVLSAGMNVTFDASASSPGLNGTATIPIANYTWDFGDGTNATTTNPTVTHTYTAEGNYTVTLTVTCRDDPVLIEENLTRDRETQIVKPPIPATVSVYPPSITGPPPGIGDAFKIYVKIENVIDLYTWLIGLSWNSSILNCAGVTYKSSFFDVNIPAPGTINNTAGIIAPYGASLTGPAGVTGTGILLEVEFLVLANASTYLNLTGVLLINSEGENITFNIVNGYFYDPPILLGDIDEDGFVGGVDLFYFGRSWYQTVDDPHYDGTPDTLGGYDYHADFDNSGRVDGGDLYWLAKNWYKEVP